MTAIQQTVEIDPSRRILRLEEPLPESVSPGRADIVLVLQGDDESIYSCLYNCISDIVLESPPLKRLFAGFDHRGNALEIIVWNDVERSRLVVFHAMKLRKQYYFLFVPKGFNTPPFRAVIKY